MTLVEQITKHLDIVSPVKENSLPGALYLRERKVTLKIAADIDNGAHTLETLQAELKRLSEIDSYSQFDGRNRHVFTSLEFVINWLEGKVDKQGQDTETSDDSQITSDNPQGPPEMTNEIKKDVIQIIKEAGQTIASHYDIHEINETGQYFWVINIEQRIAGTPTMAHWEDGIRETFKFVTDEQKNAISEYISWNLDPEDDWGLGAAWFEIDKWLLVRDLIQVATIEALSLYNVMTAAEVVEEFGLSESTVRQAINRGQVPARKSGGTWLVLRSDAEKQWKKQ